MAKLNLGLPSYEDSIFSTQQERNALKAERVTKYQLHKLEILKVIHLVLFWMMI